MSRVANITEAKAQLSRLIAGARSGKRVIIGQAGKPTFPSSWNVTAWRRWT